MHRLVRRLSFAALIIAAPGLAGAQPGAATAQSSVVTTDQPAHVISPASEMANLFSQFYPNVAVMQRVDGEVLLTCRVHLDQRADCTLEREQPDGWGFGQAAVALSRSLRFTPAVINGAPADGARVMVPIHFATDEDSREPADTMPAELGNRYGDLQPEALDLFNYLTSIHYIDLPRWESAPSPQRVQSLAPADVNHARVRIPLLCTIQVDRSLSCASDPSSTGPYVQAALQLSRDFIVSSSSETFIAAHKTAPFTLPIDFNFVEGLEPLNTLYDGRQSPLVLPSPPINVIRLAYRNGRVHGTAAGEATATCTIHANTHTCVIDRETPSGHDFGQVTVEFLQMLIPPDNAPFVEGDQVRISLSFRP